MATLLGNTLPPPLLERLQAGAAYRGGGLGAVVISVDNVGLPHCAVANCAVAAGAAAVYVPLGAGSSSERNLRRDGRCTLLLAGPGWLYYVKGSATVARERLACFPAESAVRVAVSAVYSDSEEYFSVVSGLTYRLIREVEQVAALERAIIDELTELAAAG